jgi:anti-sigma factor RsiW
MNECQNVQQQMDEYLSDRLADFARRRIESHLRQCPECAEDIECFRDAIDELRAVSSSMRVEPSLSLQYSLNRMATLPVSETPAPRHYYPILIICGLSMLFVAMLLGALRHFGTVQISLIVSLVPALVGMAALSGGILQFARSKQKLN